MEEDPPVGALREGVVPPPPPALSRWGGGGHPAAAAPPPPPAPGARGSVVIAQGRVPGVRSSNPTGGHPSAPGPRVVDLSRCHALGRGTVRLRSTVPRGTSTDPHSPVCPRSPTAHGPHAPLDPQGFA